MTFFSMHLARRHASALATLTTLLGLSAASCSNQASDTEARGVIGHYAFVEGCSGEYVGLMELALDEVDGEFLYEAAVNDQTRAPCDDVCTVETGTYQVRVDDDGKRTLRLDPDPGHDPMTQNGTLRYFDLEATGDGDLKLTTDESSERTGYLIRERNMETCKSRR